jgi:hypothetical protein
MDECLEWKELCGESRLRLRSVCHHSWSEWPQWRHHRRENWCRKLDQVSYVLTDWQLLKRSFRQVDDIKSMNITFRNR